MDEENLAGLRSRRGFGAGRAHALDGASPEFVLYPGHGMGTAAPTLDRPEGVDAVFTTRDLEATEARVAAIPHYAARFDKSDDENPGACEPRRFCSRQSPWMPSWTAAALE